MGELAVKSLYADLLDAERVLGKRRMTEIFIKSAKDAAEEVVVSKIKALTNFSFSVVKGTFKAVVIYKKDGIKGVGKLVLNKAKSTAEDLKSFVDEMIKDFRNDRRSFMKKISRIVIFSTAALLYAGGLDLEGGAPDMDLKLGVGHHRNIFSHTILLPLFLEFSMRFVLNIAEEMVKDGHGGIWKKLYDFKQEYSDVVIGGMWFGAMMHLFKDSAPLSGRTKPLTGLHGLSMETHKRILSASSALAGIFSYEELKKRKK